MNEVKSTDLVSYFSTKTRSSYPQNSQTLNILLHRLTIRCENKLFLLSFHDRNRIASWRHLEEFFRFLRRIATSPPRVSRATISNDTARILLTFRLSTKKYQRFKAKNLIKILIDEDRKKRCNIYPETILNNLEFGRKRIKNRIFYLKKKRLLSSMPTITMD